MKLELEWIDEDRNVTWLHQNQMKATRDGSNQIVHNDTYLLQKIMEKMKRLELYYSKHKLQKYDELKMNYTIVKMKWKAMESQAIEVDTWWKFGANLWYKTWKKCLPNTKQMTSCVYRRSRHTNMFTITLCVTLGESTLR